MSDDESVELELLVEAQYNKLMNEVNALRARLEGECGASNRAYRVLTRVLQAGTSAEFLRAAYALHEERTLWRIYPDEMRALVKKARIAAIAQNWDEHGLKPYAEAFPVLPKLEPIAEQEPNHRRF